MLASATIAPGVFARCIGIFASLPLGQRVLAGLYLALRNGSGLPALRPQEPVGAGIA
jgi:hypothetical protein